ncbi:hATC-domain-containing protein, partial [Sistotremastrum suecicum HHB10207 ss-3]
WGGEVEQAAEIAKGNLDAKNWTAEAETIVKKAVTAEGSSLPPSSPPPPSSDEMEVDLDKLDDDDYYDHQRRQEISRADKGGSWEQEYDDYVKDVARDVERDTDLVRWWSEHNIRYPTLSRIAIDVLPVQASSVACERLFSSAKHTATDQRSRLGTDKFEQLQMLKSSWKKNLVNVAEENAQLEEEILATEELFEGLNALDEEDNEWDMDEDQVAA